MLLRNSFNFEVAHEGKNEVDMRFGTITITVSTVFGN